jgi:hypothetical protein
VKEPRTHQDLRAEHARAVANPTAENEKADTADAHFPDEPTRPAFTPQREAGPTEAEKDIRRGAEASSYNDFVQATHEAANLTEHATSPERPSATHKLDKDSGKAVLESYLNEALGTANESANTPDRRDAAQSIPTHKLDKASGKAVLEADLKDARESDSNMNDAGRDGGRDR